MKKKPLLGLVAFVLVLAAGTAVMAYAAESGASSPGSSSITWLEQDFGETDPGLEFWEIQEFAAWMEEQRAENQELADSGDKSFYEKDASGDYICREWTQQDVDALYALWQEQLALMERGQRFTKPIIDEEGNVLVGEFCPEAS